MKVQLNFKCIVEINADDFDVAEEIAKIKAEAIMIQVRISSTYRLRYAGMSIGPALDEEMKRLNSLLQ